MPNDLYCRDYCRDALAWAEQQATLLHRLAAGERLNEAVDWPNVIDKLHAEPGSRSTGQWRSEAGSFLDNAEQRFTPSMRQRIELDGRYAKALRRAWEAVDDAGTPQPLPGICPFALDELLAGDITELTAEAWAGRNPGQPHLPFSSLRGAFATWQPRATCQNNGPCRPGSPRRGRLAMTDSLRPEASRAKCDYPGPDNTGEPPLSGQMPIHVYDVPAPRSSVVALVAMLAPAA